MPSSGQNGLRGLVRWTVRGPMRTSTVSTAVGITRWVARTLARGGRDPLVRARLAPAGLIGPAGPAVADEVRGGWDEAPHRLGKRFQTSLGLTETLRRLAPVANLECVRAGMARRGHSMTCICAWWR